jgi:Tol biopolymer transport system component
VIRTGALLAFLGAIVMTAAGSSAAPVSPDDFAKIAFVSTRDGTSEIYVMNGDGTKQTRLTVEPAQDAAPTWSPDGTRIAFTSNRDGNWEIYSMDADGRDVKRLTDNDAFDGAPSWSPDGKQIAFASSRDGNSEIYVMNDDGTQQTRRTDSPSDDTAPAWAPASPGCEAFAGDIAFESDRSGSYDLMLLRPDGSVENVTSDSQHDFDPDWAPDCSRLAFDRPVDGNYDVYTVDLATHEIVRVTTAPEEDSRPSWSADGESFAFNTLRDGHYEVYATTASGNASVDRSLSYPGADTEPSWQPGRSAPPIIELLRRAPYRGVDASRGIEQTCVIESRARNVRGTDSNDVICSEDVAQQVLAKRGNDVIMDDGGKDTIYGGPGRDTIATRDGEKDVIWGGPGVDQIYPDAFDIVRKATGDQISK